MGGAYAVDSLRIEKGYRHWSHEMDTETSPWEARLGFTVDLNKVYIIIYTYIHGIDPLNRFKVSHYRNYKTMSYVGVMHSAKPSLIHFSYNVTSFNHVPMIIIEIQC